MLFKRELPKPFLCIVGLVWFVGVFLKGWTRKEESLWAVFRQECQRKLYLVKKHSPTQFFIDNAPVYYSTVFTNHSEN